MIWSPLYENSSSLCAYISEKQIESYLGKDKNRWKALIDTKSMLRCTVLDEKRPAHLTVLEYIKESFYKETYDFAEKIITVMTEKQIHDILKPYSTLELSNNKKVLISNFLLSKIQMLKEVYIGKEE